MENVNVKGGSKMKKWSLLLIIAAVALLIPMLSANVSAEEDTSQGASISIDKSADKNSAQLGDTITYTFTITNSGNVTVDNVTVSDYKLWTTPQSVERLEPGHSVTISDKYTVVVADFPGPVINTANATGTDPNGDSVSAIASASVPLTYSAFIEVTKTATPHPASLGDTITYTYTITNTGDVTVNNLTLEDDMLGTIALGKTSLGQGDNVTATAKHTVVIGDFPGPVANTATATGTDPLGNTVTDNATVEVALNAYTASIEVTKTADKESASPHETITYTYVIINKGDVTADNLTLMDDKLGAISLNVNDKTLAPGDNVTATATYTVTIADLPGPIINTANVTGIYTDGKLVSATSNSVSVSLNKSLMTKAEILKLSGVPGKGIDTAPGLQKPFNPKSQAAEHAGKKDRDNEEEQLQIRQRTENHSDADGQLKIRQKTKHHHKK